MPYHLTHSKGRWFVSDEDGNKRPKSGYKTKGEAQKYMSALYSNVADAKKQKPMGQIGGESADTSFAALSARAKIERALNVAPNATTRFGQSNCEFIPVRSLSNPKEIEGYLALWGSPQQRDCYKTYFDKERPPKMDLNFLPKPLRYAHGQDKTVGQEYADPIGAVDRVWIDARGIAFHALLDDNAEAYPRVSTEIRRGELGVSTGVPDYLAEFDEDGRFVNWPIAEVSLTPTPCEPRMPSVTTVRSMPNTRHLQLQVSNGADAGSPRGAPGECEDCPDSNIKTELIANNNKENQMSKRGRIKRPVTVKTQPRAKRAPAEMPGAAPTDGNTALDDSGDDGEDQEAGLTLGHLGLDDTSSVSDFYNALCSLLGDNAADALLADLQGDDGEEDDGADDGLDLETEDDMSPATKERSKWTGPYDDPEEDTNTEEFTGDNEEPEDVSQRSNERLKARLTQLIKGQRTVATRSNSRQTKPANSTQSRIIQLENEVKRLRRATRDAPVDERRQTPGKRDRRETYIPAMPWGSTRDLRFDGQKPEDLAFTIKVLEAASEAGVPVGKGINRRARPASDELWRAATSGIVHEIEVGTSFLGSDNTIRYMTPFRSLSDIDRVDWPGFRRVLREQEQGRMSRRSNEVMGDTNTGFGSNYIGVFYDTALWLKVRAMPIWKELEARGMEEKVIPVGFASNVIPLEGADFTWYRVPETVDIDSTGRPKINIPPGVAGTSAQTLTVRTLGALVYYSVLLEEDSIVPMASELSRKANLESQEQIEYVIFNGDTATGTGNLNYKNQTVAANMVNNFTVADGILKAGIYGNSGANARQSAALSDLDYQLLFGLLGNNGITGADPTKLLFAVDPQTGLATDRLPIVKTKDVYSAATIEGGRATQMYGVPIFRSGQIALADGTGYIDSVTPANNKYGRIACVRPDQWVIGFKRSVTFEFFRDVPGQSNGMTITMRLGLQFRDATQCASVSYQITIK